MGNEQELTGKQRINNDFNYRAGSPSRLSAQSKLYYNYTSNSSRSTTGMLSPGCRSPVPFSPNAKEHLQMYSRTTTTPLSPLPHSSTLAPTAGLDAASTTQGPLPSHSSSASASSSDSNVLVASAIPMGKLHPLFLLLLSSFILLSLSPSPIV